MQSLSFLRVTGLFGHFQRSVFEKGDERERLDGQVNTRDPARCRKAKVLTVHTRGGVQSERWYCGRAGTVSAGICCAEKKLTAWEMHCRSQLAAILGMILIFDTPVALASRWALHGGGS